MVNASMVMVPFYELSTDSGKVQNNRQYSIIEKLFHINLL